jgi:hypothetical protein
MTTEIIVPEEYTYPITFEILVLAKTLLDLVDFLKED